jgi:4-hydroxy-L-threonine phosphate dehydrogenase PdxA
MTLPRLAITLGDVAGIGPEITAKTLLGHDDLREKAIPVVIGDEAAMRAATRRRCASSRPSRTPATSPAPSS